MDVEEALRANPSMKISDKTSSKPNLKNSMESLPERPSHGNPAFAAYNQESTINHIKMGSLPSSDRQRTLSSNCDNRQGT